METGARLAISYLLTLCVWALGPAKWLDSLLPDTLQGYTASLVVILLGSMPIAYWLTVAWEEGKCRLALNWLWKEAKRCAAKIRIAMRGHGLRLSPEERRGRYLDFTRAGGGR